MHNDEQRDGEHDGSDLVDQGLPGERDHNHEEHEPTEPTKRRPGKAGGGDPDAGGESGEGSQSTGNPDSAG